MIFRRLPFHGWPSITVNLPLHLKLADKMPKPTHAELRDKDGNVLSIVLLNGDQDEDEE